ncbi:putative PIN2-INTERACTING PROTEIN X1 domain containing protein [Babesia divergens]|uniref:PIN2-INTERACTING PROTEIN X1 domain containing protein n=1 Tax=Babesia divergens TaxID=32595 RepID=A0AAD9GDF3_BABDI|nr:putative PIN2-INTERACTING PROTEIN X1 domain containing protein [Babesia divergens]
MSKAFKKKLQASAPTGGAKVKSKFGSAILAKFGWKEGDGLGKNQDGIVDPVTLKATDQNKGLGKKEADPWHNWWDEMYNEVANKSSKITGVTAQSSSADNAGRTPLVDSYFSAHLNSSECESDLSSGNMSRRLRDYSEASSSQSSRSDDFDSESSSDDDQSENHTVGVLSNTIDADSVSSASEAGTSFNDGSDEQNSSESSASSDDASTDDGVRPVQVSTANQGGAKYPTVDRAARKRRRVRDPTNGR